MKPIHTSLRDSESIYEYDAARIFKIKRLFCPVSRNRSKKKKTFRKKTRFKLQADLRKFQID